MNLPSPSWARKVEAPAQGMTVLVISSKKRRCWALREL
jgi:hypothetical protein